jgi:hypothetical protein
MLAKERGNMPHGLIKPVDWRPHHYQTFLPKPHRPHISYCTRDGASFVDRDGNSTWIPNPVASLRTTDGYIVYIPPHKTMTEAGEKRERIDRIRSVAIAAIGVSILLFIIGGTHIDSSGAYSIGDTSMGCFVAGGILIVAAGTMWGGSVCYQRANEL